ncbi:MAG: hypothetical protein C4542_08190 [Dehalococcoidia bacterium]|nr:MAG: hypothetical protein C4542_08190 [Dehalococcoidia bacterium]
MPNSIEKLYEAGSEKFDLGDFDTFYNKMGNPQSRQKFYAAMTKHYDLGEYDAFESKVNQGFLPSDNQEPDQLEARPGYAEEQPPAPADMVSRFVQDSTANDPFLAGLSADIDAQLSDTLNLLNQPSDMGGSYNTPIPEDQQQAYLEQSAVESNQRGRDAQMDVGDYDIQGNFLAGQGKDERGHGSDQFKKPNHPTFSVESQYSGQGGEQGGTWGEENGQPTFTPGPSNLKYHSRKELEDYFKEAEPNVKLKWPEQIDMGAIQPQAEPASTTDVEGGQPQPAPQPMEAGIADDDGVLGAAVTGTLHGIFGSLGAGTFDTIAAGARSLRKQLEMPETDLTRRSGISALPESATEIGASKIADKLTKMAEKYQQPEDLQGKNLYDNPEIILDPRFTAYGLGDMLPSFLAAMIPSTAALKFGRPVAGAVGGATAGLMEGAGIYRETLDRGGSHDEALRNMLYMTVGAGLLNKIGFDRMFAKGVKGKRLIKNTATMFVEAITEYLEEPLGATILGVPKEEFIQRMKDGLAVLVPAAFMGGVGSVTSDKIEDRQNRKNLERYMKPFIENPQQFIDDRLAFINSLEQKAAPTDEAKQPSTGMTAEEETALKAEEATTEAAETEPAEVKSVLDELYGPEERPTAAPVVPTEDISAQTQTELDEAAAGMDISASVAAQEARGEEITAEPTPDIPAGEIAAETSRESAVSGERTIERRLSDREVEVERRLSEQAPIMGVDDERVPFINADVERLGSAEAVAERYDTDSAEDRYARQHAEKIFGQAGQELTLAKSGRPYKTQQAASRVARKLGADYEAVPTEGGFGIRKAETTAKLVSEAVQVEPTIDTEAVSTGSEMESVAQAKRMVAGMDYDGIQKLIDDRETELEEQGVTDYQEQSNDPLLTALYEERFAVERENMRNLDSNVRRELKASVPAIPEMFPRRLKAGVEPSAETLDFILRDEFGINPKSQTATYFTSQAVKRLFGGDYTSKQSLKKAHEGITKTLINGWAREHNLDSDGIFSPVSGLGQGEQRAILEYFSKVADNIITTVRNQLLSTTDAIAPNLGTSVPKIGTTPSKSMGLESAERQAEPRPSDTDVILASSGRPFVTEQAAKRFAATRGEGYEAVPYGDKWAVKKPAPKPKRELTEEERAKVEKELDKLEREAGVLDVTPRKSIGMHIDKPGAIDELAAEEEGPPEGIQFSIASSRPAGEPGMGVIEVMKILDPIKGKFNIPIRVLGSAEDIEDAETREAALAELKKGSVISGYYDDKANNRRGEIVLLADGIRNEKELLEAVLPHEIAHYGIQGVLGKEGYKAFLADLRSDPVIGPQINALIKQHGWKPDYAAGEWWANNAEGKNPDEISPTIWQRIVILFRKAMRAMRGAKRWRFTNIEIDNMLRKGYEYATAKDAAEIRAGTGEAAFKTQSLNDLVTQLAQIEKSISELPPVRNAMPTTGIRQRLETKAQELEERIANWDGPQFRSRKAEGEGMERKITDAARADAEQSLDDMRKDVMEYAKRYIPGSGMSRDEARKHLNAIHNAKDTNALAGAFVRLEAAVMGEEDGLGVDSQGNVIRTTFELPEETRLQHLRRWLQDSMARLQTVQKEIVKQTGKEITPEMDANMRQVLEVGRAAHRVEKFMEKMVRGKESFLGRMNEAGINQRDFSLYLTALHTEERRNATIGRKIEKARSEKQATYWRTRLNDENDDFGSGMSMKTAKRVIKDMQAWHPDIQKFAEEFYDNTTRAALRMRLESGLISQEFYDKLNETYKNYVPLKGRSDIESKRPGVSKTTGMLATGIRKARGRQSDADDPFAQTLVDFTDAITRSEQNRVRQAFLKLVEANPEPGVWSTQPAPEPVESIGEEGNIQYEEPLRKYDDNVLEVRVDGESHLISIHDIPLSQSMKGLGMERSFQFFSAINSYLRAVNIMLSPEFLITNFERDLQTALVHVSGEQSAKMAGQTLKHLPSAMKGIWKDLRGKNNEWSQYYEEMKEVGGKVSWMRLESTPEMMRKIEKELKNLNENDVAKSLEAFKAVGRLVENANEVVEMGTRLAFYRTMRENGFSADKAAQAAKELTVNFNTRGQVGPLINSLWLFANAGVQGSYRIVFKALKHKRVQQIVGGIVVLGFLQSLFNRWMDDDEWDQFSDYNKDNYWMWMMPNGKTVAVKVPYGYNVFKVAGNLAEEAAFGNLTLGQAGKRMFSAVNDAFNPLGGGSFSQFLSPTAFDPLVQITENKNFYGGPITKEQPEYAPDQPAHTLHFKGVSIWAKALTKWLNKITGGTDVVSGKVDVNPEMIDHFSDWVGGGLGRFITNTINLGATAISERDLPQIEKIPVARQMLRESSEWVDTGYIYETLNRSGANILSAKEMEHFNEAVERASAAGKITPTQKDRYLKDMRSNQAAAEASLQGSPARASLLARYEAFHSTPLEDRDKSEIKEIHKLINEHNRRAVKSGEQKISEQALDYRRDRAYEKLYGRKRPKQRGESQGRPRPPEPPRPNRKPIR